MYLHNPMATFKMNLIFIKIILYFSLYTSQKNYSCYSIFFIFDYYFSVNLDDLMINLLRLDLLTKNFLEISFNMNFKVNTFN